VPWPAGHGLSAGHPAPALISEGTGPRPAPAFVEWLMGLPSGWVTNPHHGLTSNQQLAALGNGVLPAQASTHYRSFYHLVDRANMADRHCRLPPVGQIIVSSMPPTA
jgi:hypothetical protein